MPAIASLLLPLALLGPSLAAPGGSAPAGTWTHEAALTAPPVSDWYYDQFGKSIALGASTAALGAYFDDEAGIFVYDLTADGWSEPAWLSFPGALSVIGLSGGDLLTLITSKSVDVSARTGTDWRPPASVLTVAETSTFTGPRFIGDDFMALSTSEGGGLCPSDQKRLRLFRRDGDTWIDDGRIPAEDCPGDRREYYAAAIDGDRLATIFYERDGDPPSSTLFVQVHRRQGEASWELEATLATDAGGDVPPYGVVAISGTTVALGASTAGEQRGQVDVYADRGDGWRLEQSFHGEPVAIEGWGAYLGEAVALDGDLLAVGAAGEAPVGDFGNDGFRSGAVHLYRFDGQWVEEARLSLPDPNLQLGTAVTLRHGRLLVGTQSFAQAGRHDAHVFAGLDALPPGMCLDDSQCDIGPCVDGACVPADPGADDDRDGCGCTSDGGSAPLAPLLALILVGARRRRAAL